MPKHRDSTEKLVHNSDKTIINKKLRKNGGAKQ